MSYASLGTIAPWSVYASESDEAYFWRALFTGADIRTLKDMQDVAGAIGKGQNLRLDLRGIAVEPKGSAKTYAVDAAFTTSYPRMYFPDPTFDDARDVAMKVQSALAARYPDLQISGARFEENNDDAPIHPSLDFWRYHPVIMEATFGGPMMPTAAFARWEGLYRGKASDGENLKKWKDPAPPNGGNGPPTNGNGNGNGGNGNGPSGANGPSGNDDEDTTLYWIAGGAIALWIFTRLVPRGAGAAK